jgi:hypothetical protein
VANRINDPSFELSTSWTLTVNVARTTPAGAKHGGTVLQCTEDGTSAQASQNTGNLAVSGTVYTVGFWARLTTGGDDSGQLLVRFHFDGAGGQYFEISPDGTWRLLDSDATTVLKQHGTRADPTLNNSETRAFSPGQWTWYGSSFTAPNGLEMKIAIRTLPDVTTAVWEVDDFKWDDVQAALSLTDSKLSAPYGRADMNANTTKGPAQFLRSHDDRLAGVPYKENNLTLDDRVFHGGPRHRGADLVDDDNIDDLRDGWINIHEEEQEPLI